MDDDSSLGNLETGARAALPIWIKFMAATHPDPTPLHFDIPARTKKEWMDPTTGRAAAPGAPGAVQALFINGTGPRGSLSDDSEAD
jgi:penicillin-binding protein 1A